MPIEKASQAEQIANELRAEIEAGEFPPGERLPSDREIAERFGVSKPTASKARGMLVALGLVESRAGAPSRVSDVSRRGLAAARQIERARRTGRIYPEGHYAKVIAAREVPARADVAAALQLRDGEPVVERTRVTYGGDHSPLSTSSTYFRCDLARRCPKLLATERIPKGTTVYIEQETGRQAATVATSVWAQSAGSGASTPNPRLELTAGACVLAVATTTYDSAGNVMAYEVELHPPDVRVALTISDV